YSGPIRPRGIDWAILSDLRKSSYRQLRQAGGVLCCLISIRADAHCTMSMHAYIAAEHVAKLACLRVLENVPIGYLSPDVDGRGSVREALFLVWAKGLRGREIVMDRLAGREDGGRRSEIGKAQCFSQWKWT